MNDSAFEKVEQLLGVLLRKTKAGGIKWSATVDDDAFQLNTQAATMSLSKFTFPGDEDSPWVINRRFVVTNRQGRMIEEYSPDSSMQIKQFDDLFAVARHSAFDTSGVLELIIAEIDP